MVEPSTPALPRYPFLWPALAAASASEFAAAMARQWTQLTFGPDEKTPPEPAWATPHRIALEIPIARLHDFSTAPEGTPLLLCAPFALHGATVCDFAPEHSLAQSLRAAGAERLFVCEWRSATHEMRLLAIDDYLAALNVLVDEIGGTVDLTGLCQGGWLSLLYAARFPQKVRKLVIAGAPIDIAAAPSNLSIIVDANPPALFEALVQMGDGRVFGHKMRKLWSPAFDGLDIGELLQTRLAPDSEAFAALMEAYRRWDAWTVDLPGVYYLEVIDRLYRHNALARGDFVALGKSIDLSTLMLPLYLLAARDDELVAPQQLLATEHLVGAPAHAIATAIAPCRHLGLFMGRDILDTYWPAIVRWLKEPAGTPAGSAH